MWLRLGDAIVDFSKVYRVNTKEDLLIILDFEHGNTVLEFKSKDHRDRVFEKIWNFLNGN